MQTESCVGCDYLSVCHGGCPVRTYAITGCTLRDPETSAKPVEA